MDLITGLGVLTKGMQHMPDVASKCGWVGKIVMIVLGLFWIVMLVHCLRRKFKVSMDKLAWVVVLVFLPVLGAFLYLYDRLKK